MSESERKIVEEKPDFESQLQILEEEKKETSKKRKMYILFLSVFVFSFGIFVYSYASLHAFREYDDYYGDGNKCEKTYPNENVIPNIDKEDIAFINVPAKKGDNTNTTPGNNTTGGGEEEDPDPCVPVWNIDYFKNGRPTFNLDIYGDQSYIFNPTNQKNKEGLCKINCDTNNDGWPDYNHDLNGDGIVDLNLVKDLTKTSNACDLNCDLNLDELPNTNIDTNNDGVADINITGSNYKKPIKNIDYMGNRVATFNIGDGTENPVNDATDGKICDKNCDIDGDGWPDYNIHIGGLVLNELVDSNSTSTKYRRGRTIDWKDNIYLDYDKLDYDIMVNQNKYINIDINGDGIPDLNISNDGGKTIKNEVDSSNSCSINCDLNKDGFPDKNIDINGDGKADLNIADSDNMCTKNCDTNNDGKADYLVDIYNNKLLISSIHNINIDNDYDTKCDYNCDTNLDLLPDYNIDNNDDTIPNLNIDFNKNKSTIFNRDTNHDGYPDKDIDVYGIGKCNFNCGETNENPVDTSDKCTKNCDTDKDGLPDINVDVNNDGVCDFNCDNGKTNIDSDHDFYLDSETDNSANLFEINNTETDKDFFILNPISIYATNIEPGWNGKYVLYVHNSTHYAANFNMVWKKISNSFTDNAMKFLISRNNISYLNNQSLPTKDGTIKKDLIIKSKTSIKYVLSIDFNELNYNQTEDASKTFKGQFIVKAN